MKPTPNYNAYPPKVIEMMEHCSRIKQYLIEHKNWTPAKFGMCLHSMMEGKPTCDEMNEAYEATKKG